MLSASALGQFNQWGGGGGGGAVRFRPIQPVGAIHLRLSLCLKRGRVPTTYMAILETTLLPVCFKLTLN